MSGEFHKLTREELFSHQVSTNGTPSEELLVFLFYTELR